MSAESEDIHAQKSVCGNLACRCTVMSSRWSFPRWLQIRFLCLCRIASLDNMRSHGLFLISLVLSFGLLLFLPKFDSTILPYSACMCGRTLIQVSFIFQESRAILSDLLFFTAITTGDIKQSSSTSFTLPGLQISLIFQFLFRLLLVDGERLVLLFVSPDNVPVSLVCSFQRLLWSYCFWTCPENSMDFVSFLFGYSCLIGCFRLLVWVSLTSPLHCQKRVIWFFAVDFAP